VQKKKRGGGGRHRQLEMPSAVAVGRVFGFGFAQNAQGPHRVVVVFVAGCSILGHKHAPTGIPFSFW